MMARSWSFQRNLVLNLLKRQNGKQFSTSVKSLGGGYSIQHGGDIRETPAGMCEIGKREVVFGGGNGQAVYVDTIYNPFPNIRFKEDTPEIAALRKKAEGDWRRMTVHEKKTLYRADFCQTIEEMTARSGDWMMIIAGVMMLTCITLWVDEIFNQYGKYIFLIMAALKEFRFFCALWCSDGRCKCKNA